MALMAGYFIFISGQEIVILLLVVLLLFGSKEIPRIARSLGQGMKEFRKATDEIKREIEDSSRDVVNDFKDLKDDLSRDASEVVRNVKKNLDTD
ncbi:MAG: twin-arginine translocase TatA/TatE family subunit [Bacteroidales bacterium]|nr:twin-arginine translocase TatA/TatE family subunit [Bacteroidales bacterium]MBN2698576.1 twin-arginine translocase TatA/TatE family subunit [Bacteroidales bacterium]